VVREQGRREDAVDNAAQFGITKRVTKRVIIVDAYRVSVCLRDREQLGLVGQHCESVSVTDDVGIAVRFDQFLNFIVGKCISISIVERVRERSHLIHKDSRSDDKRAHVGHAVV
jgi:hypothetical protein